LERKCVATLSDIQKNKRILDTSEDMLDELAPLWQQKRFIDYRNHDLKTCKKNREIGTRVDIQNCTGSRAKHSTMDKEGATNC